MKPTKKQVSHPRTQEVYKRALKFANDMYKIVQQFPDYEEKNFRDQLRRASSSVSANFAEGHCNVYSGKERDRLNTSLGSIAECQCFLDLAAMLGYITKEQYRKLDDDAQIILDMLGVRIDELNEIIEREDVV